MTLSRIVGLCPLKYLYVLISWSSHEVSFPYFLKLDHVQCHLPRFSYCVFRLLCHLRLRHSCSFLFHCFTITQFGYLIAASWYYCEFIAYTNTTKQENNWCTIIQTFVPPANISVHLTCTHWKCFIYYVFITLVDSQVKVKVRCNVATSWQTGKLVLQLMFFLNLLFKKHLSIY